MNFQSSSKDHLNLLDLLEMEAVTSKNLGACFIIQLPHKANLNNDLGVNYLIHASIKQF